ncbi:hypothetical protein DY000_02007528 [Brassica cretica]|uniref:Uncharacterized protein n=1 Tax=Brassica cretica TaxID=69181 RepID=A0ABQ7CIQ1_BRACR|nr:hypothetical protein DY000_02007528 [Brassica cretica]
MRRKAGVGMRKPEEQSKSCFSRHGKQRKPDTWVITPTPAPSKPVEVVVLPRKAEYGPCEKENIPGSQGTPGPYASPRFKEETPGSPYDSKEEPPGSPIASEFHQRSQGLRKNLRVPMWPQGSKDKKEARTPVQPKAHRGHNKLQRTSGYNQRSPDLNLRFQH